MTDFREADWGARATTAQRSLDHFFGAEPPQLLHNWFPVSPGSDDAFNYWWLAHLIDARLDAYERTHEPEWLEAAVRAFDNIVERNGGSLFNDYFDDMLWFALAALRLGDATGDPAHGGAAVELWWHVVEHGWNDVHGESLAWRKQQLDYKNTPANGPLIILSARLHRRDPRPEYLRFGAAAYDWLRETLVDPVTGFVEDGVNRNQDGRIDRHWRFTYNQGLFVGAAVEMHEVTGDAAHLDAAVRTARTAIAELAVDGVFIDEGDAGDEGLFKGVYFRYLRSLLERIGPAASAEFTRFVLGAADALWASGRRDGFLLAGADWRAPAVEPVPYSAQLSGIMALELAAWLAARPDYLAAVD